MSGSAKRSITVSLDGSNKSSSLPLIDGTIGPAVADIRRYRPEIRLAVLVGARR